MGGGGIFQDKPLEFLSDFLLKKSSKKKKDFEGNYVLTERDLKETWDPLMKVTVAVVVFPPWWLLCRARLVWGRGSPDDDSVPRQLPAVNCFRDITVMDCY